MLVVGAKSGMTTQGDRGKALLRRLFPLSPWVFAPEPPLS